MNFEKIIVAPQISIYKNIFKDSMSLVNLLQKDYENSLLSPWEKWYTNGFRKGAIYYLDNEENKNDTKIIKEEKKYLKEFSNILNFIKKDYFLDFEKEKGTWPNFIKNWDEVKKIPDHYYIDFFRYDISMAEMPQDRDVYMEYHVDEFPILNEYKILRNLVTINIYLNDDYDGGEICAYDSISQNSYKYKPKPGDAVVMPSTSPFYHAVKKFYNADRYFMRGFFKYEADGENLQYNEEEKNKDIYIKNHLQTIKINTKEIEVK